VLDHVRVTSLPAEVEVGVAASVTVGSGGSTIVDWEHVNTHVNASKAIEPNSFTLTVEEVRTSLGTKRFKLSDVEVFTTVALTTVSVAVHGAQGLPGRGVHGLHSVSCTVLVTYRVITVGFPLI
jgi:hypothetical protein